jgi:hypothetical protein
MRQTLFRSEPDGRNGFKKTNLTESLAHQLEKMLDGLGHKDFSEPHNPDRSLERPAGGLDRFQRSTGQFLPDEPLRQRRHSQASAYQALDGVGSPHIHHISDVHAFGLEPPADERARI